MSKTSRIEQLEEDVHQLRRLVNALYFYHKYSLMPNGKIEPWVTPEEANEKLYNPRF